MTDPADCGPVTLAFCQDVQAEAFDWPEEFFAPKVWRQRRPEPDARELADAIKAIRAAKNPFIVAGGGVHYSGATQALKAFVETHKIPVAETQAGKSALPWDHPLNMGPIGVTGASSANSVAENADLVIGVGTRFQDFTTGSWGAVQEPRPPHPGAERAVLRRLQARRAAADLRCARGPCQAFRGAWQVQGQGCPMRALKKAWFAAADAVTAAPAADSNALPTDMQVIGAVQRSAKPDTVVMCAAGTMPGELHKLWKAGKPMSYHMEYGFSTMGYEIAGGIGIKMAEPARDVVVMLGDGSYMMMNSELATAVMMGIKLTIVITDNRGFGCINRLQMATGGAEFNNLLDHARHETPSHIDFAVHAASMGAKTTKVGIDRRA